MKACYLTVVAVFVFGQSATSSADELWLGELEGRTPTVQVPAGSKHSPVKVENGLLGRVVLAESRLSVRYEVHAKRPALVRPDAQDEYLWYREVPLGDRVLRCARTEQDGRITALATWSGQPTVNFSATLADVEQMPDFLMVAVSYRTQPHALPQGVITAVKDNFVEISLGSDDGMREGRQLDVFRMTKPPRLIARIVVRKASPDHSVAEVVVENQTKDPMKGDRVRAREPLAPPDKAEAKDKPEAEPPKAKADLRGKVLHRNHSMVLINLGKADGLAVGMLMQIRGPDADEPHASLKLTKILGPHLAEGRRDLLIKGEQVTVGDVVEAAK